MQRSGIQCRSVSHVTIHTMLMRSAIVGMEQPQYGEVPYRPDENMALYADIRKAQEVWVGPQSQLERGLENNHWMMKVHA